MSPNNAPRSTFITSPAVQETMKMFPATQPIGFQFNPTRQSTKEGVTPGKKPSAAQTSRTQGEVPIPADFASNTVEGPPSIVELSRALNVDSNGPQYMFEYVYNNIDWEPGWGVQKGALGTICDGVGNSFDQSLLLANLLRQAGFTANIVMGTIRLLDTQYEAWWNVPDIWGAQSYCLNEYIPIVTAPTWNGTQYYMDIRHVWVEWVDGATTYYFDPCMKTYTRKTGLSGSSLASALGYVSATFLSDAESGATIDGSGNFVQNMNRTNIRADLQTYTTNLVSYIGSNAIGSAPAGTATVDDVLGGQAIVPVTLPVLNTSLGYEAPGDTPTVWTGDVPSTYKPTLQVQFPDWYNPGTWDFTWSTTSDLLACTRLSLWYSGTLVPSLYLNGTSVATGLAQPSGTYTSIYLTLEHPAYAASNYPLSYQQYYQSTWTWWQSNIYAGDYYLVGNAWGNLGRGQLDYHQTQAAAAIAAGDSSTSEALLGEQLAITFFQWAGQNSRACDLVNRIMSCKTMYSHQVGMISFNDGGSNAQTTDLGGVSGSSDYLPNSSDYATETSINDTVIAMHGVALEAATCAQMNGITPGIATTSVLDRANRTAITTIGGTITAGDVLTITVHDTALSGGTKSDSHTVVGTDTLTTIATALASAINGDSSLSAIGVTATSSGALVFLSSMSANQTSYTSSTSGGATETITIAFEKIYQTTTANWTAGIDVESILVANGYNSSDMTNLYNSYITYGDQVVIADHPNTTLGSWTGWGYWAYPASGAYGNCNGVMKFGGGQPGGPGIPPQPPNKPNQCDTGDPIDIQTGDFRYHSIDLTIGSTVYPYQLSFEKFYDSRIRYFDSPLGLGWNHNWNCSALVASDGFRALGSGSAIDASASIAEFFVCTDILSDTTRPVAKLVTMTLCDKWWIDQVCNNVVIVSLPRGDYSFLLLPGGTYQPQMNDASTLTLAAGLYTHTTPQQIVSNFNSAGQLSTVVFPSGVTITLSYTGGKLTSVTNGLGRTLTLSYSGSYISSVSDGTGRSVSYTIDSSNDLTVFTDALLAQTNFSYVSPGLMQQMFLPQNPSNAVFINTFDSLDRVASQQDIYGNTSHMYLAGSRSELTDPNGNSIVSYFDANGNVLKSIDQLENVTTYSFDGIGRIIQKVLPEGNSIQWTYDSKNNILTETRICKPGAGLSNTVKTWTYDATYNKRHTLLDALGNTWTWNFDSATGNLLSFVKPVVGGFTPEESWTYNARGQVLTYTDETGIVRKNTYDSTTEELLTIVDDYNAGGGHLNLTTQLAYDSMGNTNSITDPNSNQSTYTFDNNRRLTQKTDPSPFGYITNIGYDLNGNITSFQRQATSVPTYQTYLIGYTLSNKVHTLTDPALKVTTKTYDNLDRLWTVTDAQGREYTYAYDVRSNLYTITDPSTTISETRLYSNNGLLSSIKDANNHTTQYTYDGFDRPNETIYADSSFEQNSSYDANNNVLTFVARSGNSIVNTYDTLNRLSTKAPTSEATVTFTYDLHNRKLTSSTPIVSGNPATGTFNFYYDTAGRFYEESTPDSKTTTFVLDSNGNVTQITYPDGYYITRVYDQLNRLTDIKLNGASSSAVHITYDELSRRQTMTLGNGVSIGYTYTLNEDLVSLAEVFVGSSVTFGYGFNNVHQEISRSATDSTYLWHPSGTATTSYGTANSVNEYPTVGGTSYSYDGNANLSGNGTWTYTYDTENHLVSANETGTSVSYVYDGDHRQIQKTVGSTTSYYVYSGWQRIADYASSGSGALQNRYVYGDKLDEPLIAVSSAGVLTYLHADRLGSIIATTNSSGAVTNKNIYSAFGENAPVGTTFGFTGQRYDSDTGLYYYKRRYYSPSIGRFLQPDPIGYTYKFPVSMIYLQQTFNSAVVDVDCSCGCDCGNVFQRFLAIPIADLNLYTYVHNDPLNLIDPYGLVYAAMLADCLRAAELAFDECINAALSTEVCPQELAAAELVCVLGDLAYVSFCWAQEAAGNWNPGRN